MTTQVTTQVTTQTGHTPAIEDVRGDVLNVTTASGQVSSSVEITLTAKGVYTWTIKCYVEPIRFDTSDGQTSLVTMLADLDQALRARFVAPTPQH